MTGNEIKQKIKSFCKEYKLAEVSCQSLRAVIEKQGYTIVEYNQRRHVMGTVWMRSTIMWERSRNRSATCVLVAVRGRRRMFSRTIRRSQWRCAACASRSG